MLVTVNLQDKTLYLYRRFYLLWSNVTVECQICFDKITTDGVIIVSEHATLNLEKMFHAKCLNKWNATTQNKQRDPFNRQIKFKFNFPPKSLEECSIMLEHTRGFIGEEPADKQYSLEYNRVQNEPTLDIELDLDSLLAY
nr:ac53 [Calliteara abietis nucleopolyhedrovirus]